jgi:tRNA(Ile)-lysidine synthase
LYHVLVHALAERVLGQIRREELLRAGDRVGVAVSGGIDSVALLRLLMELRHEIGIVLSVVHFNHKLRAAGSDADQQFVAALAHAHDLEFHSESGDVARVAAEQYSGVEAAARELRYAFFRRLLGSDEDALDEDASDEDASHEDASGERTAAEASQSPPASALTKIATGHTLDDQAETVLMRVIRGTGLRGLGGIYPRIIVEHEDVEHEDNKGDGHGEIIRPLLGFRHSELQQYLADLSQTWREDSTNSDSKFTRNRVRSLVLPLLEREFNPAVVENLAELADIARDEEDYWENEVSGWLGTVVQWSQPEWIRSLSAAGNGQALIQIQSSQVQSSQIQPPQAASRDQELLDGLEEPGPELQNEALNASVSRPWLLTEPRAVQRRVLKAIGEEMGIPLEFKHIEEILRFAAEDGPSGKELSLPLGWRIVREPEAMVFLTPDLRRQEKIPDYEYSLVVPGRVSVPELGLIIEALRMPSESQPAEYNLLELLRAELLRERLIVRNWRPGDRFWPAHTKSPKKIKELLQEQHVAQPERRLWPVVMSGSEIVWMRGFPVPASLHAQPGQQAVLIRELPQPD